MNGLEELLVLWGVPTCDVLTITRDVIARMITGKWHYHGLSHAAMFVHIQRIIPMKYAGNEVGCRGHVRARDEYMIARAVWEQRRAAQRLRLTEAAAVLHEAGLPLLMSTHVLSFLEPCPSPCLRLPNIMIHCDLCRLRVRGYGAFVLHVANSSRHAKDAALGAMIRGPMGR